MPWAIINGWCIFYYHNQEGKLLQKRQKCRACTITQNWKNLEMFWKIKQKKYFCLISLHNYKKNTTLGVIIQESLQFNFMLLRWHALLSLCYYYFSLLVLLFYFCFYYFLPSAKRKIFNCRQNKILCGGKSRK